MAATVGKDGSVKIGTVTITFIDSWSVNPSADAVDITQYGSSFRDRVETIKDWSGSFTGTLDRSDTNQAALFARLESGGTLSNVALRLYTSTSEYWSGNALVNNQTITSNVADKVAVTWNFVGNGALSFGTST